MAEAASRGPRAAPPPFARRMAGHLAVATVSLLVLLLVMNAYVYIATSSRIVGGVSHAEPREVAIVLGNRVLPDGTPGEQLRARLQLALALYREKRVRRILVSGATWPGGYDEASAMAKWLQEQGVSPVDLLLDRAGHRTAATMANAAALGVREALVCSQPYHLPRAVYLASKAGIDAVGVPARDQAGAADALRYVLREGLARAQAVVEVIVFGVTAR